MVGAHQHLNGLRHLTIPLSGLVCHSWLALATVNLSIKFEVAISTPTKICKGIQNAQNGVV